MTTVRARVQDVGGVLMLELPETVKVSMDLSSGSEVTLGYGADALNLTRVRPRYRLQDLLDRCDPEAEFSEEDRAWEQMVPVGRELL